MIFVPSFSALERKAQKKQRGEMQWNKPKVTPLTESDNSASLPSITFYSALRDFSEYFFFLFQPPLFRLFCDFHHFGKCFISLIEQSLSEPELTKWAFFLSLISFSMHSVSLHLLIFFPSFSYCKQSYISLHRLQAHTQLLRVQGGVVVICLFLKCFQEDKTFQAISIWNVFILFHL